MKKPALLLLAFACALAGCSTANVTAQGGRFTAGSNVNGASVGVDIQGGSAAGAIISFAALAALIGGWRNDSSLGGVPPMLEGRAINEVDCTQPIQDWSKNLKCR